MNDNIYLVTQKNNAILLKYTLLNAYKVYDKNNDFIIDFEIFLHRERLNVTIEKTQFAQSDYLNKTVKVTLSKFYANSHKKMVIVEATFFHSTNTRPIVTNDFNDTYAQNNYTITETVRRVFNSLKPNFFND